MSILVMAISQLLAAFGGLVVSIILVDEGKLPEFWGPVGVPTIVFLVGAIVGMLIGSAIEAVIAKFWLHKFWGKND
jgi:hypothetical protein